jgi:predicted transposase YbfD/YdcC
MQELAYYFEQVEDYRVVNRCLHLLPDILGLVLCGTLADCDTFSEIIDYSEDKIDFLRSDLGFTLPHGIPSQDTLERVFNRINPLEVQKSYHTLLQDLSLVGKHIVLDGKELRSTVPSGKKHSSLQLVNAWVNAWGLSFGQQRIEKKSNEIKAIPELLQLIDCKGSVVSIDAIACQKKVVGQIREQQADYVISLKKNQGNLYEQVCAEMQRQKPYLSEHESHDLGHGRSELRRVYVSENLDFIDEKAAWKDLSSIVLVERSRWKEGKETSTESFYISSLVGKTPEEMAGYIRNHWSIENQLHWQLDFTFREDKASTKNENALQNLHLMKKWALFLLKKDPDKKSIKRKRKKAHRNNQYLKKIITQ